MHDPINMKGGNTVKLLSILVLAVWVLLAGSVRSDTSSNTCRGDSKLRPPNYNSEKYTVDTKSPDAYRKMIARLRELLTMRGEYRQGIPIRPERTSVSDSQRYILLEITVGDTAGGVTFAIDVTNVYIVGYLVGTTRYFFLEAPARAEDLLFTTADNQPSPRKSSNYAKLEQNAGASRRAFPLGLASLADAIRTLITRRPEDARSQLIVIQMVSEAVRYWEIEWNVLQNPSFLPDSRIIGFQNNWSALSLQIQTSDAFAFQRPITIGDQVADSVQSAVIKALFLMLFRCARPHNLQLPMEEGRCKRMTDPATEILGSDLCLSIDPPLQKADDKCKHLADPRSRIRGRDGLCVDVEGFIYRDGTPVVLFACRSSDFSNQLWKFRADGMVVSLDKCLAATGVNPGSTVVIHQCDTLHDSAVQWVMSNSGTLSNRGSGLVLDAASGSGKQLKLQSDTNSSFQAWQRTNNIKAVDVYIHGENNRCIYYNGDYGIYVEGCRKDYSWQKWRLYPDSTIRPIQQLRGCLELNSFKNSTWFYNYIQFGNCLWYADYHRWIFTHEGTIMNLKSNLVIDEDRDYPGKGWLKAAPFQGGLNQIWKLEFIK